EVVEPQSHQECGEDAVMAGCHAAGARKGRLEDDARHFVCVGDVCSGDTSEGPAVDVDALGINLGPGNQGVVSEVCGLVHPGLRGSTTARPVARIIDDE